MQRSYFYKLFMNDAIGRYVVGAIFAMMFIVPVCNLLVPEGSFLHIPTYTVMLFGKYLCYAMLALALDLVWGYCGILSLGHGAFFALGGYAMGMYLMRQIGDRGVYGNPELPDFMVFLNWQELPWFWHGFDSFPFAMLMVLLVPGILGFLFGWLAFRSRVTGVYLSIISQAMTLALLKAFYLNDFGFGGNNGLTDFKDILGFDLQADSTRVTLFVLTAFFLIVAYMVCRFIVESKLGRIIVAIRDSESRTRFLGYRVEYYKLFVFVVSSVLAGIAGALFVPQVGIINPGEFHPINSIEIVIWVALGGRGTLYGAILGGVVVNFAKSSFTDLFAEDWLFLLGVMFVCATIFTGRGTIYGVILSVVVSSLLSALIPAGILIFFAIGIIFSMAYAYHRFGSQIDDWLLSKLAGILSPIKNKIGSEGSSANV